MACEAPEAMESAGQVTRLLVAHRQGDPNALHELLPLVYDDLRRLARRQRRRGRQDETLTTTALVHEAYLRLVQLTHLSWRDRGHFYAVAAIAMRRIVVDHARARKTAKRGAGAPHVELTEQLATADVRAEWMLALDATLLRLERIEARLVRIVECRFFAGHSEQETATALGLSLRTVQRDWTRAREWLKVELRGN